MPRTEDPRVSGLIVWISSQRTMATRRILADRLDALIRSHADESARADGERRA
jgi:hypothetical protein